MEWLIGVAVVVVGLVVLDRLVAHGVVRLPHLTVRRDPGDEPGSGVASGMLGDLVELFQPSQAHWTEEQQRRRLDRQQAGDAAPPVDLEAGVARLDRPAPERPETTPGAEPSAAASDPAPDPADEPRPDADA